MSTPPASAKSIFLQAVELLSAQERQEFLAARCGDDADLRREVEELLRHHGEIGDFLGTPAVEELREGNNEATQAQPESVAELSLEFLSPPEKPGQLGRLGHYEVREVIGHGGMGVVLRAFDEKLHRVVAIKVMAAQLATNATARKRFIREAQAQAAVSHDHIVTIHAVEDPPAPPLGQGGPGGVPYLVMQYVAGLSLQQRLDRDGPLELHEILRIGMQTAAALAAAHAQGLVHRDIKPANILLENGVERVKITDFGLARAAAEVSLTQSGQIAGTPQYMSPEQARGETLDQRTDLFSLGSVLYAMCTGRAPFRASGSIAVLKRVCEETPTPIRDTNPEIPDWLVTIIDKLHAKHPAERFQTAAEVAALLKEHLAHVQHPSVAPLPAASLLPSSLVGEGSGVRVRRRWAVAAAAALVLLIGGLGLTEATGVTQVLPTVIRIVTGEGTLVVEVDDPGIRVQIDGGDLTITGAGLHEFRLRPGSYQVEATKDGKPVHPDRELVTITRGDKQVVRVRLEAESPAAVQPTAAAEPAAFVLLGGTGVEVRKFNTLAEAVRRASDGDTIEIRGNGPFVTDPIRPGSKTLTIRAGAGYAPVIEPSQAEVQDDAHLFKSDSGFILEGLELHVPKHSKYPSLVAAVSGPLYLANCKLVVNRIQGAQSWVDASQVQMRNCLIVAPDFIMLHSLPRMQWAIENCLIATHEDAFNFLPASEDAYSGTKLRLTRNTLVSVRHVISLAGPGDALADRLRAGKPVAPALIEAEENICQAGRVFYLNSVTPKYPQGLPVEEQRQAIPNFVQWRERSNVYALEKEPFLGLHAPYTGLLNDLAEWNQFWGLEDTGSVQGSVLLRGNPKDIITEAPEDITPEDFRLRPDSAGYRAGADGKDLGADVDLVGPGAAYERWKQTPAYQAWLAETGQVKPETPKAEPKAFVVLGGEGVEVRKYDTLAEAVRGASDGDTIEVRGNGPFITDPLDLGSKALSIRAGSGYAPVITNNPATPKPGPTSPNLLYLLTTRGALTLEGLELRFEARRDEVERYLVSSSAPLSITNCKLVLPRGNDSQARAINSGASGRMRNCLIVSANYALLLENFSGTQWSADNCLIAASAAPSVYLPLDAENAAGSHLRLTRNTLVAYEVLTVPGQSAALVGRLRDQSDKPVVPALVETEDNICQVLRVLYLLYPEGLSQDQDEQRRILPKLIRWRERGNVYDLEGQRFLGLNPEPAGVFKDLAEWNEFWGLNDTGSRQGAVRMQGNPKDLIAEAPEAITPEDFRLRPDSAGYRAGPDGKDLGADIDLVGPGAAYERWKQTPAYQEWLVETGQFRTGPNPEPTPFVLLDGMSGVESEFATLAEAVQNAYDADAIEVRGNGPFVTEPIAINQALTIRAGDGYRPSFRLSPPEDKGVMLSSNAPLVLEGLDFQLARQEKSTASRSSAAIQTVGRSLHIAKCRFQSQPGENHVCIDTSSALCVVRDSLFLNAGHVAVEVNLPSCKSCSVENCVFLGNIVVRPLLFAPPTEETEIKLTGNTLLALTPNQSAVVVVTSYISPEKWTQEGKLIPVRARGNIIDEPQIIAFGQSEDHWKELPSTEADTFLARVLSWQDRDNLYAAGGDRAFWSTDAPGGVPGPRSLAEWKRYWDDSEAKCREGHLRFRGGDLGARLAKAPDQITLDDFRLRADSAGYHAGEDGKDLGADVDLVGPGPAYEAWKKTPQYQEWLDETRQARPHALRPEPKAFALVGGAGVPEARFDTLSEAVLASSDGDTIEVRGNGPFISEAVSISHDLTIRAGQGFRPLIRFERRAPGIPGDYLLASSAHLTLEGLEFRIRSRTDNGFVRAGPALDVANCRFYVPGVQYTIGSAPETRHCRLRNCEFVAFVALIGAHASGGEWIIENCVYADGAVAMYDSRSGGPNGAVHISHVSVCSQPLRGAIGFIPGSLEQKVQFQVSDSVFCPDVLLSVCRSESLHEDGTPFTPEGFAGLLPKPMTFAGTRNVYSSYDPNRAEVQYLMSWADNDIWRHESLQNLEAWSDLWGSPETDCTEGRVQFANGDLGAKIVRDLDQVTPDDFRLAEGSPGYRAGADGKDLGADVDLVGPGAAYERWKKTPAYQEWLADTGQVKVDLPQAERNAFVVLSGTGDDVGEYDTLAEASQRASDGDTIEIRGNGPFVTDPIKITDRTLTLRAGVGQRPIIKLSADRLSAPGTPNKGPLLQSNAPLVLQGLELRRAAQPGKLDPDQAPPCFVFANGKALHVANCRFRSDSRDVISHDCIVADIPQCHVRNCEFLGPAEVAVQLSTPRSKAVTLENCVHVGRLVFHLGALDRRTNAAVIRLTHNTVVTNDAQALHATISGEGMLNEPQADQRVTLEARGNIIDAAFVLTLQTSGASMPPAAADDEAALLHLLRWEGQENFYLPRKQFVGWTHGLEYQAPHGPENLGDWKGFWNSTETDSLQGSLRLQGGDLPARLTAAPAQLTSEDFRLRPDSAGYQAGIDGKDLGADVDLVGPGPAYERWKETPEYQVWLKETGQSK